MPPGQSIAVTRTRHRGRVPRYCVRLLRSHHERDASVWFYRPGGGRYPAGPSIILEFD